VKRCSRRPDRGACRVRCKSITAAGWRQHHRLALPSAILARKHRNQRYLPCWERGQYTLSYSDNFPLCLKVRASRSTELLWLTDFMMLLSSASINGRLDYRANDARRQKAYVTILIWCMNYAHREIRDHASHHIDHTQDGAPDCALSQCTSHVAARSYLNSTAIAARSLMPSRICYGQAPRPSAKPSKEHPGAYAWV
jgi:hypothetical protein